MFRVVVSSLFLVVVVTVGARVVTDDDVFHPEVTPRNFSPRSNAAENSAQYWIDEAQKSIESRRSSINSKGKARNVVMFLGDGMSVPTLAAARILLGQRNNQNGEEAQLSFEKFPSLGLAKVNKIYYFKNKNRALVSIEIIID